MPRNQFSPSSIYQLIITLDMSDPPVWRKVLVPSDIQLGDLHYILQIAMGWENRHLHQFIIGGKHYGMPDPDYPADSSSPIFDESKYMLSELAPEEGTSFGYEYDFGDSWSHTVLVEKILERERGVRYPVCTAGEMACPPEDVGGIPGYQEFVKAIADRRHPEHRELLAWIGGKFDPKKFGAEEINMALRDLR